MAGRMAAGTERALRKWKPGDDINALAVRHGINPSTLYRALVREGKLSKPDQIAVDPDKACVLERHRGGG